jgi:ribose transport system permease protein
MRAAPQGLKDRASRLLTEHGPLLALVLLALFFSVITLSRQSASGHAAAEQVAGYVEDALARGKRVLILAGPGSDDALFADFLGHRLEAEGFVVLATVKGEPWEARQAIEKALESGAPPDAIACSGSAASYPFVRGLDSAFASLSATKVLAPEPSYWPNFLKASNLLNLLTQNVIFAILAIGMTLVIVTGGIDLSVGSLVGLSAVLATLMVREWMGGAEASGTQMALSCVLAVLACGVAGATCGAMVTIFDIPPFIVTLSMMLVASGLAFILAQGETIFEVPASFNWFASGKLIPHVPNAIVLTAILYAAAHLVMTRTVLGRYIYAVGGNREAARLSGVPVKGVLLFVYTLCGLLAGLAGVVHASQFNAASATYGLQYELAVIAAVVVGGTSLFGGEGKVLGTLVGTLVLGVILNGMNLVGLGSYPQKVVLGLVILGAAVLDSWKTR